MRTSEINDDGVRHQQGAPGQIEAGRIGTATFETRTGNSLATSTPGRASLVRRASHYPSAPALMSQAPSQIKDPQPRAVPPQAEPAIRKLSASNSADTLQVASSSSFTDQDSSGQQTTKEAAACFLKIIVDTYCATVFRLDQTNRPSPAATHTRRELPTIPEEVNSSLAERHLWDASLETLRLTARGLSNDRLCASRRATSHPDTLEQLERALSLAYGRNFPDMKVEQANAPAKTLLENFRQAINDEMSRRFFGEALTPLTALHTLPQDIYGEMSRSKNELVAIHSWQDPERGALPRLYDLEFIALPPLRTAMSNVLRGLHERFRQESETRTCYLTRLLQTHAPNVRHALEKNDRVNWYIYLLTQHLDDPMARQYIRILNELRAISSGDAGVAGSQVSRRRPWPNHPIESVGYVPRQRGAGSSNKVGPRLTLWLQYNATSEGVRAKMRIQKLEKIADLQVDALLSALTCEPAAKRAKPDISLLLTQLHDAVKNLRAEIAEQAIDRSADDYLHDAVQRALSHCLLDLKTLWGVFLEEDWEPAATSFTPPWNRAPSYRVALAPPDRAAAETGVVGLPNHPGWAATTWSAIRDLVEQEMDVRTICHILTGLADQLVWPTNSDGYVAAIRNALDELVCLDAQQTGDRDIGSAAFKSALQRLAPSKREAIMHFLKEYARVSGGQMVDFTALKGTLLMPNENWFYGKLLRDLCSAGLSLDWKGTE
jgi:hypothetical protein